MKKIFLLILALSTPCFGRVIIIEKTSDGFRVLDYINANGSPSIVRYGAIDDKTTILAMMGTGVTGLSKVADRAVIYTDEFGFIEKVDYQVDAGSKPERKVLVSKVVMQSVDPKVDAVKVEVNTKTGHVEKPVPVDPTAVLDAVAIPE